MGLVQSDSNPCKKREFGHTWRPSRCPCADEVRAGCLQARERPQEKSTGNTHMRTHSCMHAHTHSCAHPHLFVHTHAHTFVHVHTQAHTCVHTDIRSCMHTSTHACTHMHTLIHTHTHTRACTHISTHVLAHNYTRVHTRVTAPPLDGGPTDVFVGCFQLMLRFFSPGEPFSRDRTLQACPRLPKLTFLEKSLPVPKLKKERHVAVGHFLGQGWP